MLLMVSYQHLILSKLKGLLDLQMLIDENHVVYQP